MSAFPFVAAASTDLGQLGNYGVLGILFLAFITAITTAWLVPGWVYRQHLADKDRELERARAETTALRTRVDEQVIPLMVQAVPLLSEAVRIIDRERNPR